MFDMDGVTTGNFQLSLNFTEVFLLQDKGYINTVNHYNYNYVALHLAGQLLV